MVIPFDERMKLIRGPPGGRVQVQQAALADQVATFALVVPALFVHLLSAHPLPGRFEAFLAHGEVGGTS